MGTVLTFWWVCLAWVFFRTAGEYPAPFTQDLAEAWTVFKAFVFLASPGTREVSGSLGWFVALAILAVVHVLVRVRPRVAVWERMPDWAFAISYGFMFSMVVAFLPTQYKPFIYFQF